VALELDTEMQERVDRLVAERERMLASLDGIDRVTAYPSGANFVLFKVHGDGHALWQELVDRGVLVRDCSGWPRLHDCLRVTVGTPDENDAFLAALRESAREVAA
jgi:histidinol-phosphate aminotransferase